MAQIFHPSANVIARFSIVIAGVGALGALVAGSAISRSPWNTKVGVALAQPVPFSHQHHAAELGIDCRYCHTSVDKAASAGVPPTHTCMSCHSQVWTNSPLLQPVRESYRTGTPLQWNRVNSVPDFVYFNHSIHVNRGINCNICHGPVQKMMITHKGKAFFMAWCLDCHRHPEKFVRDRKDEFAVYDKVQSGGKMTREEEYITEGRVSTYGAPTDYQRNAEETAAGEKLVAVYHIKKAQLTDCWVCHR